MAVECIYLHFLVILLCTSVFSENISFLGTLHGLSASVVRLAVVMGLLLSVITVNGRQVYASVMTGLCFLVLIAFFLATDRIRIRQREGRLMKMLWNSRFRNISIYVNLFFKLFATVKCELLGIFLNPKLQLAFSSECSFWWIFVSQRPSVLRNSRKRYSCISSYLLRNFHQ